MYVAYRAICVGHNSNSSSRSRKSFMILFLSESIFFILRTYVLLPIFFSISSFNASFSSRISYIFSTKSSSPWLALGIPLEERFFSAFSCSFSAYNLSNCSLSPLGYNAAALLGGDAIFASCSAWLSLIIWMRSWSSATCYSNCWFIITVASSFTLTFFTTVGAPREGKRCTPKAGPPPSENSCFISGSSGTLIASFSKSFISYIFL